jgi:hypothetical protein
MKKGASSRPLAFAMLVCVSMASGQTVAPDDQQAASPCAARRPLPPLPANAEQVAGEIEVLPLVQRLRALASECDGHMSIEELSLRQQITEGVVAASLDLNGVMGSIDFEVAQIMELRDRLSGAKDHKVNTLTLASIIVGTGSGTLGTAMQFSGPAAKAGDWVQTIGGAVGIVFSVLALVEQGAKGALDVAPNMLAPVFDRRAELRSVYPEDVWKYLNTAPATDPRVHVPWKDELIGEWEQVGRIGPPSAPESQKKISKLTSRIADHAKLSIGDLTDRSAMLMDLRSRLSLMNRDLHDLMKAIAIPAAQ